MHSAATVHPFIGLHPSTVLTTGFVLGAWVGDGLTKHLPTRAQRITHCAGAFHEAASAVDTTLLPCAVDISMLLVWRLLVGVKIQLDGSHSVAIVLLRVIDQCPDTFASICLLVLSLQNTNYRSGRLVPLFICEKKLAPGFPNTTFWCHQGCLHQSFEEPLVCRKVARYHTSEGVGHGVIDDIAQLAGRCIAPVTRTVCRTVTWLHHFTGANRGSSFAPLHQVAQLFVGHERAILWLQGLQHAASFIYQGSLHFSRFGACNLRQQAAVATPLHGQSQGLLLCQFVQFFLFGLTNLDGQRGFMALSDRHFDHSPFSGRVEAVADLQLLSSHGHAPCPQLRGHEVSAAEGVGHQRGGARHCRGTGPDLHLHPKRHRGNAGHRKLAQDGTTGSQLPNSFTQGKWYWKGFQDLTFQQFQGQLGISHLRGHSQRCPAACDGLPRGTPDWW